jgi:hypothetical protein
MFLDFISLLILPLKISHSSDDHFLRHRTAISVHRLGNSESNWTAIVNNRLILLLIKDFGDARGCIGAVEKLWKTSKQELWRLNATLIPWD